MIDVDVPPESQTSPPTLTFDPEWLAITRAFTPHMSLARPQATYPDEGPARGAVARALEWVREHALKGQAALKVEDVQTFVRTAPGPGSEGAQARVQRESRPVAVALGALIANV